MALTKVKINLGTQGNLSGSRSIIQTTKTLVSSSAQLSSEISGSFTTASSSFSTRVSTIEGSGTAQGVGTSDSPTFNNLTATGTVTAQEFHSEFVSASVTFTSGSHKFGNSGDDIQHMTGSLRLSGSITNESYIIGTNVGIGTNNPATKLHIQGSGNTDGIRLANTGYSYYNEIKNNGDGLLIDVDKGDAGGAGADLRINISDTERLRITNDGELGINSNNPDEELEVFGATDVGIKLRALGTTTTAGSHVPTISLQSNQGDGVTARASISADRDGAATKGALIFSSRVSDNITEVMRINGSGKVGIGTTGPADLLEVNNGNFKVSGSNQRIFVREDGGQNSVELGHSTSATYDGFLALTDDSGTTQTLLTSGTGVSYINNGNVGIGTTNPTSILDVETASGGSLLYEDSGDGLLSLLNSSGTALIRLEARSGEHNYINNGGNLGIGTNAPRDELDVVGNININGSGTRQIKFDDGSESEGAIVFDEITDGFIFKVGGTSGSGKKDALHIANTGYVGIGTSSPDRHLHVHAQGGGQAVAVFEDTAANANVLIQAPGSDKNSILNFGDAASTEIGQIDYDHANNSMKFVVNTNEHLTFGSDGSIIQPRGHYSRLSGNWEILDVVSRNSDSSDIQSSNCFADNRYGYFKVVIPYISGDTDGADLQLTFLYNSGGGLTEDTTYYYGHKQTMGHGSSGYGGAAYDNQSQMTVFTNHWSNANSGGIQGELYIYNVTYHDTSNFDTSIFSAHAYTGNGDRGNYYRPIGRGELMGYNTGGTYGYARDSSFFRNNNDRDPDHWKGFRLKFSTGNVRAQSRFIVLGMPL